MLRPFLTALSAILLLGACASTVVRYIDPAGKEYPGSVDPLRNTITAYIGDKTYRGPYRANDWGQARSTLTAAGGEPLYCDFYYKGLKVQGTCTDLTGGEYRLQSR